MPLVDWNVAQELEDYLMDGIDAVIPVGKTGKKYVLCAWYRKSVWKILEEQLKTGDYKVQRCTGKSEGMLCGSSGNYRRTGEIL